MMLQYPLGLLGLLAIPVLIIIYIIKNKYTEQTVTSTYLWTLSEKFLKRKNPLSRLTGIISLILQILAVIFISLAITHPVIILPASADEYLFLLDASGSMNMTDGESSRFDRAKGEISSLIDGAVNGSNYTLVVMGDTDAVIYERADSKDRAKLLLDEIECSSSAANGGDALNKAQEYFDGNRSMLVYLVTDKNYNSSDNIRLVNVGDEQNNFALSNVNYVQSYAEKTVTVTGSAISYLTGGTLKVDVYADDNAQPTGNFSASADAGESVPFTITFSCEDFTRLTVKLENADGLMSDNEYVLYNAKYENAYKTLIVSDRPFFLKTIIETLSGSAPDVVSTEKYDKNASGYGLYVFDCFSPEALPQDGTVWLFGTEASIPGSGFSVQGKVEFDSMQKFDYTKATSTTVRKLLSGIVTDANDPAHRGVYSSNYIKYSQYSKFTTLLSYRNNPVVFTGESMGGNREVVFAFDLADTNFALLSDFIILAKNLLSFSFPAVLDSVLYPCGETAEINVISGCDSLKVTSPSGESSYLGIDGSFAELKLTEVGVYKITMTTGTEAKEFNFFSYLPEEESAPAVTEETFSLAGAYEEGGIDGQFDALIIILILLSLIFLADWGVYCYEQYQLR